MAERQKMRFNDAELSLIKNTFADNDDALKTLRKIMLQLPLSAVDEAIYINTFKGKEELLKVIRKSFLPTLDGDAPVFQVVDLWATVELKEKTPEEAMMTLQSRDILIQYLDQQLNYLANSKTKIEIIYSDLVKYQDKQAVNALAEFIARNTMLNHTEQQLSQFILLAGTKVETVDQTKKRLSKDSSK